MFSKLVRIFYVNCNIWCPLCSNCYQLQGLGVCYNIHIAWKGRDNIRTAVAQLCHLSCWWALLSLVSIADTVLPSEAAQSRYRANPNKFSSIISSSITSSLCCYGAQKVKIFTLTILPLPNFTSFRDVHLLPFSPPAFQMGFVSGFPYSYRVFPH